MPAWAEPLGRPNGAESIGRYRMLLWRSWSDAPPLVVVMLNPSKADAVVNDPTIRKVCGFAMRLGFGGIIVVNLFPWRATDPRELYDAYKRREIILPIANRVALAKARELGPFVYAWGAGFRPWMDGAASIARSIGGLGRCWGLTKMGQPRHPLMLPYATPLEVYA